MKFSRRSSLFLLGSAALGLSASSDSFASSPSKETHIKSVLEFGAKGDGKSDDTIAIQAALDALGNVGGGIVTVPSGNYWLEGTLKIPSGVTLQGTWKAPVGHRMWRGQPGPELSGLGTNFMTTHGHGKITAKPFIRMLSSSSVCGIAIFHPRQTKTNPPIEYPWAIASEEYGTDYRVEDIFLANCYQGIDFGTVFAGRHLIRNIYGDALHRGIFISQCLDVGRIENVHFWPFWDTDLDSPIRKYVQHEAVAFEFGRSDWQMCTHTFCWGYGTGYRFITHGQGIHRGATHGSFLGVAADACSIAMKIEQTTLAGLLITNGQFVSFPGEAIIIDVEESNAGTVRFVNSSFWGPCEQIARIKGEGTVGFGDSTFLNWGYNREQAAIHCDGGKLLIRGCEFQENKPQVLLTDKVKKAIICNNLLNGDLQVDYPEDLKITISGNI